MAFYRKLINIKNGGLHWLIRSQNFDFSNCCNLFYILMLILAPIVCVGGGLAGCSVVLGALSSLAIIPLGMIELIALL